MQLDGTKVGRKSLHLLKNPTPNHRVLLDQFKFFAGELPGLLQNAVGYAYLAEVVQKGADTKPLHVCRPKIHCLCNCARKLTDPPTVTCSVPVAGVESVRERTDELEICGLKICTCRTDGYCSAGVKLSQFPDYKDRRRLLFQLGEHASAHCLPKMRNHCRNRLNNSVG